MSYESSFNLPAPLRAKAICNFHFAIFNLLSLPTTLFTHLGRRILHGFHYILIPRTPAEIPRYPPSYLFFGGVRVLAKQRVRGQYHAGSAEPALQPVFLFEAFLQWMKLPVVSDAFYGHQLAPIGLDGEQRARLYCSAVEQHCASAAVAGVAPDVGSGQGEHFSYEVHEQQPGLNRCF